MPNYSCRVLSNNRVTKIQKGQSAWVATLKTSGKSMQVKSEGHSCLRYKHMRVYVIIDDLVRKRNCISLTFFHF